MKKHLLAAFAVLLGTSAVLSSAWGRWGCHSCHRCHSCYDSDYGYSRGGWNSGWGDSGYWW